MNPKLEKLRQILPVEALMIGVCLMGMEMLLFRSGVDAHGLIRPDSSVGTVLAVASVLAVAVFALSAWKVEGTIGIPMPAFAPKTTRISAIGIGFLSYDAVVDGGDPISYVAAFIGAVAAVSLLAGVFAAKLRRPSYTLTSLFFAIHCVLRYRMSSADPQLHDYVFPLLAEIVLMLCFFYYAAAGREEDNLRLRNFWRCCGIALCCGAIIRGGAAFVCQLPFLLIMNGDET